MSVLDFVTSYIVNHTGHTRNAVQKMGQSRVECVRNEALLIADYLFKYHILHLDEPPPDRVCETAHWLVQEFLDGNKSTLSSLVRSLSEHAIEGRSSEEIVHKVFESMFEDGKVNWGRIGAAYAFAVKYLLNPSRKHEKSGKDINGNDSYTTSEDFAVLRAVGEYVGEKLAPWIIEQGGWDAMCTAFPNRETALEKIRSAGVLFLTLGIGSLLTALTS